MQVLSRATNIHIEKYNKNFYTFDGDRLCEAEKAVLEKGLFKDTSEIRKELSKHGITLDAYRKWKGSASSPGKENIKILADVFGLESEYELLTIADHLETERRYNNMKKGILEEPRILELLRKDEDFYKKIYEDKVAVYGITAKMTEENVVQILVEYKTGIRSWELLVEQGKTAKKVVSKFAEQYLYLTKEQFASVYYGIQKPVVNVEVEVENETDIEVTVNLDDAYPIEHSAYDFSIGLTDVEEEHFRLRSEGGETRTSMRSLKIF